MGERSDDEQTLIRIQREWAEARAKGDSSYTQRLEAEDCTIVWPDGSVVNKTAGFANHDRRHRIHRIQNR
jgi:hypothetical protein